MRQVHGQEGHRRAPYQGDRDRRGVTQKGGDDETDQDRQAQPQPGEGPQPLEATERQDRGRIAILNPTYLLLARR